MGHQAHRERIDQTFTQPDGGQSQPPLHERQQLFFGHHSQVDERFAEVGVPPRVAMEMRSPEAMRKLVEAGVGISFLPQMTAAESLASGLLKVVEVEGVAFGREIGVAWRRGRYFGPAIRYLLEAIFAEYGGQEEWISSMSSA